MTTAFVLGGGGVLGAVEVGMLRALFERGVTPDLVLGPSPSDRHPDHHYQQDYHVHGPGYCGAFRVVRF